MFNASVSVYSLISAILYFNMNMIIISILRCNILFKLKYSTSILIIIFLGSLLRFMLPFEFPCTYVIESKWILPHIIHILSIIIYHNLSFGKILCILWIVGILITLLRTIYKLYHEHQKHKSYFCINDDVQLSRIKRNNFYKNANIILTPSIAVPQVTGFIHAQIYLPPLNLNDNEIHYILKHEMQHFLGKDIFIKLFYELLKILFWWNPIVYLFQKELYNLLELRCDLKVTSKMTYEEKIHYLETIIKVLKQVNYIPEKSKTTSLLINNTDLIKQRFELILEQGNPKYTFLKATTGLIITILLCSSYMFILQPTYTPDDNKQLYYENSLDEDNNFLIRFQDGHIEYYKDNTFIRNISAIELNKKPYSNYQIYDGK